MLAVGQELVLTLPNPSERDISRERVNSSDLSVLQVLSVPGSIAESAVLRVDFRALQVGAAAVTAQGMFPYAVQVDVVAA